MESLLVNKNRSWPNFLTIPLAKARERVDWATGDSVRLISRIDTEYSSISWSNGSGHVQLNHFLLLYMRRKKSKPINGFDGFDKCVVSFQLYGEKHLLFIQLERNNGPQFTFLLYEASDQKRLSTTSDHICSALVCYPQPKIQTISVD